MLYFRFNEDNFIAPQQECTIIRYKDGIISAPKKEIQSVDLGKVEGFFFDKLREELHLSEVGTNHALGDVIGIPIDAFSIDDEKIGNLDGVIKYALSEYTKLPIKKLDNMSLNDLGIRIEFCKRFSNEEVDSKLEAFIQTNNVAYVTEDVLWKNMTADEQAKKFS